MRLSADTGSAPEQNASVIHSVTTQHSIQDRLDPHHHVTLSPATNAARGPHRAVDVTGLPGDAPVVPASTRENPASVAGEPRGLCAVIPGG